MTSERLLSNFLTETPPPPLTTRQQRIIDPTRVAEQDNRYYELHHLVGLHSTTGDTVRDYFQQKQKQQSSSSSSSATCSLPSTHPIIPWQIPDTGISPLHVAVFRNSYHVLSVLQALLEINPTLTELPMMDGNVPLHIYLQYAMTMDRRVLELLLSHNNRNLPNGHGDRPMTLLYHNVLRFQWARNWELYDLPPINSSTQQKSWMTIVAPHQFLEYALLLLYTRDDMEQMCQSPECPPLLVRIVQLGLGQDAMLQQHPFLLHAAARATASCRPPRWHEDTPWPTLISYLFQQQPESNDTRDDACQRLPMHYALLHSTNVSDMRRLVSVSYEEVDPVTQLPPALLYASRDDDDDEGAIDLDWLYELVRSYPMVCASFG